MRQLVCVVSSLQILTFSSVCRPGLLTLVTAAVNVVSLSADAQSINIAPARMVSAAVPGWEHAEYVADVDPDDPNRVMVCSMRFSQAENRLTSGVYTSFDGGERWALSHVDSSSRFNGVWDPACAYGTNGQAFFVTLSLADTALFAPKDHHAYGAWSMGGSEEMRVFRSTNDGHGWLLPIKMGMIDRENLQVDRGRDSPYRGRMYLYGRTSTIWVLYSADSGRTWNRSERETVVTDGNHHLEWAGTVHPDGTLLLPFAIHRAKTDSTPATSTLAIATSTDGGKNIRQPIPVTGTSAGCVGEAAALSSDHSAGPFRGRVYIMWSDWYRNRCALFIAYSDDKGRRWSAPIRATAPRPSKRKRLEHMLPQIVVNGNGAVGITWYDWGIDSIAREGRLRFTASLDGGDTWLPNVVVSSRSLTIKTPPEFAVHAVVSGGGRRRTRERTDSVTVGVWPAPRSYYAWNAAPGDYAGMAAGADGVFHAFWIANPTGVGELYTAQVTVNGTVRRLSDGELANLENVTSAIEFQYTSSVWDAKTRMLSLEYQLLNTSRDTIVGPLKLRIVRLESDLGVPTLLLGRASTGGTGTILDVSHTVPATGLAPGQAISPQTMKVTLDEIIDILDNPQRDVLHLTMHAYATRRR